MAVYATMKKTKSKASLDMETENCKTGQKHEY